MISLRKRRRKKQTKKPIPDLVAWIVATSAPRLPTPHVLRQKTDGQSPPPPFQGQALGPPGALGIHLCKGDVWGVVTASNLRPPRPKIEGFGQVVIQPANMTLTQGPILCGPSHTSVKVQRCHLGYTVPYGHLLFLPV